MTPAQGRKFGFTVGIAFLVFAGISWWRGHVIAPWVLATPGALLVLGGLLVPTHLGPVERGWMALAHAISRVTTPIVMSVIYFVVLTPVGALRRAFGGNPLVHEQASDGFWKARPAGQRRSASMERQF